MAAAGSKSMDDIFIDFVAEMYDRLTSPHSESGMLGGRLLGRTRYNNVIFNKKGFPYEGKESFKTIDERVTFFNNVSQDATYYLKKVDSNLTNFSLPALLDFNHLLEIYTGDPVEYIKHFITLIKVYTNREQGREEALTEFIKKSLANPNYDSYRTPIVTFGDKWYEVPPIRSVFIGLYRMNKFANEYSEQINKLGQKAGARRTLRNKKKKNRNSPSLKTVGDK
jgi:hypothetical protein